MEEHVFYVLTCLLLFIPATDGQTIAISQSSDFVDFLKGRNATLIWSVNITGASWNALQIGRNEKKSDDDLKKVIEIQQPQTRKIFLPGRSMDIEVQGTSSVFNVLFTLVNLTSTDQMYYRLFVATNPFAIGTEYVFVNVLVLPGTPVIQVKRDQPKWCVNNNITFNCTAVLGNPTNTNLTFQQNNSTFKVEKETQGVAVITKTLMQAGTFSFSCFATNLAGTTPSSNVVTITVKDPPVIKNCTIKEDVKEFEKLSWTCEVSGGEPLNTSWYKGNNMTFFQSGSSLNITNVSRADSGNYTLKASNGEECPPASTTVQLDVQFLPAKPVLQLQPNQQEFRLDNLINITCKTSIGNPADTIFTFFLNNVKIWVKNGTVKDSYSHAVLTRDLKQLGQLGIFSYHCLATNLVGNSSKSDAVNITVTDPPAKPVLAIQPNQLGFCLNDTINLTCNASIGYPVETNVTFLLNNVEIEKKTNTVKDSYSHAVLSRHLNQTGTFLFTCLATNLVGDSPKSDAANITVKKPPVITNCTNNTAVEGEPLIWTCKINGSEPLTTSFYKENDNNAIKLGSNVSRTDAGMYTVTVSNGVGCSPVNKTEVYLIVHFLPGKPVLQPHNQELCLNGTFTMTCNASVGNPAETNFTFFLNNVEIGQKAGTVKGSYSHAVFSINLNQTGTFSFSCLATNLVGDSSKSDAVIINVKEPPAITSCTNSTAPQGLPLSWTCEASGSDPLATSWHKGNNMAVFQPGSSLNITNVSIADSGMYTFKASNGEECPAANTTVHLNVQYKPERLSVIQASGGYVDVKEGGTVNITCSAMGNPQPYYQWSFGGQMLSGITNDTISIKATRDDDGIYTCTAINKVGSATINVALRVHYIRNASCDATTDPNPVSENSNFTLNCSSLGYPPVNYTWMLLGNKQVYQPTTTVKATTMYDEAVVTCKAQNDAGIKNCSKTITVHYKPRNVTVSPASVTPLNINDSISLNCTAKSNPPGNYTWSLNGKLLTGETSSALTKENITTQDAGNYTCTVTNSEGHTTSNVVVVNVNYSPKIECDSQRVVHETTTDFVFQCNKPSGFPSPSLTALFNGKRYNSRSVSIDRVNKTLNGSIFECFASNSLGNDSCTTTLIVGFIRSYNLRCDNCVWNKNLRDQNSADFRENKKNWTITLKKVFNSTNYSNVTVESFNNGSVIVNFVLTLTEDLSDPLSPLREELKRTGGSLGSYSVDPDSLRSGIYVPPTPSTTPSTTTAPKEPVTTPSESGLGIEAIIGIVVGCVLFVIIIILVYCCYCKKRNDDDNKHMPLEDGRGIPLEDKEQVVAANTANGSHRETSVKGRENMGMSGSPSTTAKHANAANGNNNAENADVYAQVDRSKKTKKPYQDEVIYADLSHGGKKSGAADLSLNSSDKVPEKHESEYAEIVGTRRGNQSEDKQDNPDKKEEAPSASTSQTNPADKEEETPSASTSQTNNDTKEDEGSQVGVEVKGTSSAPTSANSSSTRDHTTLTTVSM